MSECCTVPGKLTQKMEKYSHSKSVVKNGQKIQLKRAEILVVMGLGFLMGWARGNSKYLLYFTKALFYFAGADVTIFEPLDLKSEGLTY